MASGGVSRADNQAVAPVQAVRGRNAAIGRCLSALPECFFAYGKRSTRLLQLSVPAVRQTLTRWMLMDGVSTSRRQWTRNPSANLPLLDAT